MGACVCVCACVRVRACVCVRVCVCSMVENLYHHSRYLPCFVPSKLISVSPVLA